MSKVVECVIPAMLMCSDNTTYSVSLDAVVRLYLRFEQLEWWNGILVHA